MGGFRYSEQQVLRTLDAAFDPYALTGIGVNNDDGVRVSGSHDPTRGQDIAAVVVDVRVALQAAPGYLYIACADYVRYGLKDAATMRGITPELFSTDLRAACARLAHWLNTGKWK